MSLVPGSRTLSGVLDMRRKRREWAELGPGLVEPGSEVLGSFAQLVDFGPKIPQRSATRGQS